MRYSMNTLRDSYDTVFDFGCSVTMYRWITWSDWIALGVKANRFYKTSFPGAGLRYVYLQLNHIYHNYDFTNNDLVLISLPTMDRKDVCNTNDYQIDYNNNIASWSSKGSLHFNEDTATSMSEGHHGEPRINLADLFMENLCYLEQILKLFKMLPCDKIITHTDAWNYDPVKYLELDYHYQNHLSEYDPRAVDELRMTAQRIRDQYSDTLIEISDILSYENFITRSHAERSTDSDTELFVSMDPHPTPDQALEFVKKHFLNHNHCEIIDNDFAEVMQNFDLTKSKTLEGPDCVYAHTQTVHGWLGENDNYYYDFEWLFATPNQRLSRMPTDRCKKFNWPDLTLKDIIDV